MSSRERRAWMGVVAFSAAASTSVAQIGDNAKIRISRNFWAEYNAKVMAIPEAERAWPAIRDASARLPQPPDEVEFTAVRGRWPAGLGALDGAVARMR